MKIEDPEVLRIDIRNFVIKVDICASAQAYEISVRYMMANQFRFRMMCLEKSFRCVDYVVEKVKDIHGEKSSICDIEITANMKKYLDQQVVRILDVR